MELLTKRPEGQDPQPFAQGSVCPLPARGGMSSAKGAMGSAVLTLIL
jgi:hypothetical protein